MPTETSQVLNYDLGDFEKFLSEFSKSAGSEKFQYFTDAIFHLLLPGKREKEKRFDIGLGIWALWALRKILITGGAQGASHARPTAPFGFRLLPTSAHQDTLTPLVDELPANERDLYGYGSDGSPDMSKTIASGLSNNLAALNRSSLFELLRESTKTARKIGRILSKIAERSGKDLPRGTVPRVAELVFRQQLELAVLRQTPCPHQAVFLTYELSPESKAWVQWARESGKRVIHVMHGQRLPSYQVTMATDLVLLSKVDEPWFRKRIDPEIKIWTTGHPRLEAIRREVGTAGMMEVSRLPRIAFFSQPVEGDYSREARLDDWRILSGLKGRAEVRLRLHPREDGDAAVKDLRKIGADFIQLSDAGLQRDLAWCDAIASSWSTVSMEAAACGRGVFWTCSSPDKYEASRELRDIGIGSLIQNPEDWEPHLQAWTAGGWKQPVIIPEAGLQKLGMIGDMGTTWISRLGISEPDQLC